MQNKVAENDNGKEGTSELDVDSQQLGSTHEIDSITEQQFGGIELEPKQTAFEPDDHDRHGPIKESKAMSPVVEDVVGEAN